MPPAWTERTSHKGLLTFSLHFSCLSQPLNSNRVCNSEVNIQILSGPGALPISCVPGDYLDSAHLPIVRETIFACSGRERYRANPWLLFVTLKDNRAKALPREEKSFASQAERLSVD